MHTLLKVHFKSYKKDIFLYCLSILKKNSNIFNTKTLDKFREYKQLEHFTSIPAYLSKKKKIHKYTMLRATHEFKYSWEKYIECIHNLRYAIFIEINKNTNVFVKQLTKLVQTKQFIKELRQIRKTSKLLNTLKNLCIYQIFRTKTKSIRYDTLEQYLIVKNVF